MDAQIAKTALFVLQRFLAEAAKVGK